ncbi:hypothetical protein O181_054198 [Austropuccinia psidii MF-1]|uniref:Reverse transcriptase Ty1/copia-type domain-containing protein n=1 Tax=Austropuccinia psidii MF-1 TaxID=1389203 RepID=A0A9Q3E8V7_9BASI|nr:hypothetical protein [Austropuccinia psidii MF-1]
MPSGFQPDSTFAVNFLARFNHSPTEDCWLLLDHIIGYLNNTTNKMLLLTPKPHQTLELWTDANLGVQFEWSTSVVLILYAGCQIKCILKRQRMVTMITCASEYVALGETAQHLAHPINLTKVLDIKIQKLSIVITSIQYLS